MKKGAIPKSEPEDAYHIAIASVNHLDALASWNFKHIVSVNPIRKGIILKFYGNSRMISIFKNN
jgi:hypothetical protein